MATYYGDYVERTSSGATRKWRAILVYTHSQSEVDFTINTQLWLDLSGGSGTTMGISSGNKCTGTISIAGSSVKSDSKPDSGTKTVNGEDDWHLITYSHTYSRTHSQQTKTLSGKVSIASGSVWHGSSTATCSDKIVIPAKKSYTIKYNGNGNTGGTVPGNQTKWYGENLTLSSSKPTKTGYSFHYWKDSSGNTFVAGGPYGINASTTLTAQWNPNTYTISFNANGGSGDAPIGRVVEYNTRFTFPDRNTLTKNNYEFVGWSTNPNAQTAQYEAGQSIVWTSASNVTYYAVWKPITATVTYWKYAKDALTVESNFDNVDNYIRYIRSEAIKNTAYTIENISVENLSNYSFSGYWYLNKPYDGEHTELGITLPKGILPYNYVVSEKDNFLSYDGIGSHAIDVSTDINLFPIYRDNTQSLITTIKSSYDYIGDGVSEYQYFLYSSNQIDSIDTRISNDIVATCLLLKSNNLQVDLDISNIQVQLRKESDSSVDIKLEPVYYKKIKSEASTDFYIVCKNTGINSGSDIGRLVDYETSNYVLTISNLKDNLGKSINSTSINISPPKILQDINKNGDVISFFTKAPDDDTLEENQVLIGGNIIIGLPRYLQYDSGGTISLDTQLYNMITSLGLETDIIEINI